MKMSSLYQWIFAVVLIAWVGSESTQAATLSECEKKAKQIKKYCEDLVKETTSGNNNDIVAYTNTINPSGQGGIVNTAISDPALQQQRINEIASARANANAKKCAEQESECKKACDASTAPPAEKGEVSKVGEMCKKDVKEKKKAMEGAGKQNSDNAAGSGKTGETSGSQQGGQQQGGGQQGGGGQPPGGGSPSQQPQQSSDQSKPTTMPGSDAKKTEAVDCTQTQFATSPQCKQQQALDRCKENPSLPTCNTSEMKTASFCSESSNSSCPSCKGMSAQSLATASQSELQSMCTGSCASDPQLGPNLADKCRSVVASKVGTQSVGGGGSSGAGGGGGSGLGTSAAAMIDASNLRIPDVQGSREGNSLAVDGAGGFSGYGGGPGGGSSSLSGDSGGVGGAKPASASGPGLVAAAKDIERQNGFSVTKIVSDVLRNRCEKGRFLHCGK